MARKLNVLQIASGLFLATLGGVLVGTNPVQAAVYCNGVGLPQGCVARSTSAAPVARTAAATPGAGAPGAGLRAGTPMNRGGPVNRVGRR